MDQSTRERLTEAARACRILEMEGHGDMTLGHLSLRDDDGSGFWMKRNRIGLGEVLGPDDFVLVDWDGKQIAGSGGRHSEWPIHSEIFRKRSDVNVVVHSHPLHASICSAITEPLQPFTLDADYFVEVPRHEADVALLRPKERRPGAGAIARQELRDFHRQSRRDVLRHEHRARDLRRRVSRESLQSAAHRARRQYATIDAEEGGANKRHQQIMTPVHWEHCWHYFCRKLEARARRGQSEAIFG